MNKCEVTLALVIGLYTFFVVHLVFLNSEVIVVQIAGQCQE